MYKLILFSIAVTIVNAAPGYPDFDFGHSSLFSGHSAPIFSAPAEPVYSPAIFKSAPVFAAAPIEHAPAPIFKTLASPVFKHVEAPVFKSIVTPIVKEVAPIIKYAPVAPVIKAAPATSYATVTSYQVAHATPVVKTIVQPQPIIKAVYQPQPIIKSFIPEHDFSYGHGHY